MPINTGNIHGHLIKYSRSFWHEKTAKTHSESSQVWLDLGTSPTRNII